jgi:hypothetical protein
MLAKTIGKETSMSRMNLAMTLSLGWALISSVSVAWAYDPNANMDSIATAGASDTALIDLTMPSVNDPAAIDMLFTEGDSIASILEGLKEKGFHIQYREKHFSPSMTLLSLPSASRIDAVLQEILEPWNFKVYRSPLGQWVVTPNKKKISNGQDQKTRELVKIYKETHGVQNDPTQRSDEN